jgi:hypothetical protein
MSDLNNMAEVFSQCFDWKHGQCQIQINERHCACGCHKEEA